MAEPRLYKVRFYQVECLKDDDEPVPFETVVGRVYRRPPVVDAPGSRYWQVNKHLALLTKWMKTTSGRYHGILAKCRMEGLPHKMDGEGTESELGLLEDEHLLEKSHFLYDPGRRVVAIQQNFLAYTASALGRYLYDLTPDVHALRFNPILSMDAVKRLLNSELVREVELQIARANSSLFSDSPLTSGVARMLSNTSGDRITIRISAGRKGRLFSDVKRWLADLRPFATRLRAKVIEEEGDKIEKVDLLTGRIVEEIEVPMSGRYPEEKALFAALERAYQAAHKAIDASIESIT